MSHQPAIAENGSKCEDTIDAVRTLSHRNLFVTGQYLSGANHDRPRYLSAGEGHGRD